MTGGGKLPAKFVIHVAGPVWGEGDEDEKLRRAVRNSLKLATDRKLKSIAFPAISTGIYGFPVERAAKLMLKEAADHLHGDTGLESVTFCVFEDRVYRVFEKSLADPL